MKAKLLLSKLMNQFFKSIKGAFMSSDRDSQEEFSERESIRKAYLVSTYPEAFEKAFERIIGHEGGYVNHPNDPGGETNFGITKRVAREAGYTGEMIDLTLGEAKDIYHTGYWLRARATAYHPAIGFQLFDAAVNHGIGNAIRMLQRAVGVVDDGLVGPITLKAIDELEPSVVVKKFAAERLRFYAKLNHFTQFGRGWTRRVADNLEFAVADLSKAEFR